MTRDYQAEVLAYLERQSANGVRIQKELRIAPSKLYHLLLKLENAGEIRWKPLTKTDGVWEIERATVNSS